MEEFDNYSIPKIKAVSFQMQFTIAPQKEHEFAHYINLTSKLIERSYMQTYKLVEKWPLELIIRRYELATKHHGQLSPQVKWWYERKRGIK